MIAPKPTTGPRPLQNREQTMEEESWLRMPYHAPGSLIETEYWQLTAFILDLNGYELDNIVLNPETVPIFKLK